jgi:uncharacterized protein (DUF2147 family)
MQRLCLIPLCDIIIDITHTEQLYIAQSSKRLLHMNKTIFTAFAIAAIFATMIVASTMIVAAQTAKAKSARPLNNPGADNRSDKANMRLAEVQECALRVCQDE